MSKIVLKKVYLLNWYGFVDKTIPVGENLTLVTGENECGKSTVLDAIKYAFTGDTDFNKATSATRVGVGKRTIASYTRCLTDPDTRKCARPSNLFPNIHTHIALEYDNELYHTSFVLGVVLETNASDSVDNHWYCLEGKTLKDIRFYREENDKKMVLSAKEFRRENNALLMTKTDGVFKFMNMVGLRIQSPEKLHSYQRKLKSIMTYNPEAKIQQFIKQSVLEEKNISLKKLKESKTSIDEITKSFEILENEVKSLESILTSFDHYDRISSRLLRDEAKVHYKKVLTAKFQLNKNNTELETSRKEMESLDAMLKEASANQESRARELQKAQRQLEDMDGTKAIQDEKEHLSTLQPKARELKDKIQVLHALTIRIKDFIERMQLTFDLVDLSDKDIDSKVKIAQMDELNTKVDKLYADLMQKSFKLEEELDKVQNTINEQVAIIHACDRNLPDYTKVSDQLGLLQDINKKFKDLQLNTEAKFASTFVVELKDEGWRNAIETFLGIHRYSIVVEPQYFDIANSVMDQSKYKYVELVNTKLLSTKQFNVEDDSLLHLLEIKNEIAKKYFAFWLGNIHAVDIQDVPNYEKALSKEGKMSRNMSVTFLNFKKLKSYCLGQDAVRLNKERAVKEKKRLEEVEKDLLIQQNNINQSIEATKAMQQLLHKDYDYYAPKAYSEVQVEIYECSDRIEKLEEALKHNNEYLTLVDRITSMEADLKQLALRIDQYKTEYIRLDESTKRLKEDNQHLEYDVQTATKKLEEMQEQYSKEVQEAKEEYNQFVEGRSKIGDVMLPQSRKNVENEKVKIQNSIIREQSTYVSGKRSEDMLPVGTEYESVYRSRYNKLKIDSLEEIKMKLSKQTRKYESIFKNEFVLRIKTNIEEALSDIKKINNQLRKLTFSTTYRFDVKVITGASDYAKIVDYADYLKKTNRIDSDQMMLGEVFDYDPQETEKREEEMKEIVNRIINKNNDDLLNDFADYRNYMEYEVLVNNDEVQSGRLSRLAGYNSGAGTQIPYTIILSAALSIIYNARDNSARLVFIDEPFEKMSDKNIKIMLEFFKSQDFQVIFCAPPNKLDSIGKECDVVVPIKKINKSNMILGAIKFHE